jgi:hypothetical protein
MICVFSKPAHSQEQLDLNEAMQNGYVTISFSGLGGSSGDSVIATVTRTKAAGSRRLSLSVRPGTMLRSRTGGEQSMTVAAVKGQMVDSSRYSPSERIVISSENIVRYLIEAYCAEFTKDNPSDTTAFSLEPPDATLACVLEASRKSKLSVPATQAAVWIVTDHLNFATMREKFQVSNSEWNQAEVIVRGCPGR